MSAVAETLMDTSESDGLAVVRAREYLLLATLLRAPINEELLSRVGAIMGDASPLGMAHVGLAEAAQRMDAARVGREYFHLFVGVGRGELLPYASFYLTGFLNERPLARVREDLTKLGLERAEGNFDPEDHISTLLETMAVLAEAGDVEAEAEFFARHLKPWAERFFADLRTAPSADFYRAVAVVGLTFLSIEQTAFGIPEGGARAAGQAGPARLN